MRQSSPEGNPYCCHEPETAVYLEEERVSLETVKVQKVARCANCGTLEEIIETTKRLP
jgi:hypothetical protein